MSAKTITKTVYSFRELLEMQEKGQVSSKVVDRVRQILTEWNTFDNWYDYVYDKWIEILDKIGFECAEIQFSGFWNQGDGASFIANINISKLAELMSVGKNDLDKIPHYVNPLYSRLSSLHYWCYAKVERISHQYSHSNTCQTSICLGCGRQADKIENLLDEFEKDVERLRLRLCLSIYKDLKNEYEYRCSDESLLDLADANDYVFDIYGHPESLS